MPGFRRLKEHVRHFAAELPHSHERLYPPLMRSREPTTPTKCVGDRPRPHERGDPGSACSVALGLIVTERCLGQSKPDAALLPAA